MLCCSLREGDGAHRLGCLSYIHPGEGSRAAAAAHADCFLRRMHERFVYEDFVARLPPLPSPSWWPKILRLNMTARASLQKFSVTSGSSLIKPLL